MAKSIIICGGGNSIPFNDEQFKLNGKGLDPKLEEVIKNNYSIGLNSFYKYGCDTTLLCFCDDKFYFSHYEALKKLPLIVGKNQPSITSKNKTLDNTILLPITDNYWGMESWDINYKMCRSCGYKVLKNKNQKFCPTCKSFLFPIAFYSGHLSGLLSLTLSIALGFKEIYLLGFDSCEINGKTHFYQNFVQVNNINYGIGTTKDKKGNKVYRTGTYNDVKVLNERWYAPYKDLEGIDIYNVSLNSAITVFPKISYTTMYEHIGNSSVNQSEATKEIKNAILDKCH